MRAVTGDDERLFETQAAIRFTPDKHSRRTPMPGQNPEMPAETRRQLDEHQARDERAMADAYRRLTEARNDDTGRYQDAEAEQAEHALGSAYRFDVDEIHHRFAFHPASNAEKRNEHTSAREACKQAALHLAELCPAGYELSEAIKRLEEAMFWANAALARR